MSKLYFQEKDSETCSDIEVIKDEMRTNDIKTKIVYEAQIQKVDGFFWCKAIGEICESKISCGKICKDYEPRNGINGICKYWSNLYEPSNKTKTITLTDKTN